eukprot:TRINITY_DN3309_c0_g1_i1.p1 TRINITY_DN3309_c0_g1~~TRINITY_DN3309_c0_g1_i1.p1  ORF type:complete len:205 (-),score=41.42 TRINITY_DN3309_c0_g1_i1:330-944(-)
MADVKKFLNELPPVTRVLLCSNVALTAALSIGIVHPAYLALSQNAITKLQIWRMFTTLFTSSFSFGFVMNLFFLYQHSKQLEEEGFLSKTADYVWMLIVSSLFLVTCGILLRVPFMNNSFIMLIVYVWARKFPGIPMSYMFGIKFKSEYLPWVMTLMHVLMGGSPLQDILGIVSGHLYWFLADVLPKTHKVCFVVCLFSLCHCA